MLTYIVVADPARARVFARTGPGALSEIDTLVDLRSPTRPGESGVARNGGNRRTDTPVGAIESEAASFANKVAQHMRQFRIDHAADAFVIAADPHFLGLLREQLDDSTRDMIVQSVSKDYSSATAEDIERDISQF